MYTRSYDNESRIKIPENYDGNAFFEAPTPDAPPPPEKEKEPLIAPWDAPKAPPPEEESVPTLAGIKGGGIFGKYLKKLPFGSLNIFGDGGFKLGTEEILIIGVALFLFFSGGGDKECAIMLLLLLLVN